MVTVFVLLVDCDELVRLSSFDWGWGCHGRNSSVWLIARAVWWQYCTSVLLACSGALGLVWLLAAVAAALAARLGAASLFVVVDVAPSTFMSLSSAYVCNRRWLREQWEII